MNPQDSRLSGDNNSTGIGLAVSGGGARGLAVIGVLKVLEKERVKINFIAGVSMGGIISGLYSCGYSPEEIENIALGLNWSQLLSPGPLRNTLLTSQKGQSEKSLISLRFHGWRPVMPRAVTAAQNLSFLLEKLTAKGGIRSSISFDYLNPPLRIICTDISTGDEVILSSGNLGEALRATMAAPVAFTPIEIDGRLLVDGGLIDPIPIDVVREHVNCPVIVVNSSSELLPDMANRDVIDMADQTTTIMAMDKKERAMQKADLVIIPDLKGRLATDFADVPGIIKAGEEAAKAAVPALKELASEDSDSTLEEPAYTICGSGITGLTSLPRTFFAATFNDMPIMSGSMIRDNVIRAYSSGYLKDCWAELLPESSGYMVEYHLVDNPRISKVNLRGATVFSEVELTRVIGARPGTIMNFKNIDDDKKALEDNYISNGYSLARVNSAFDTLNGELTFNIDEGRINQIQITGNKKTRNWVISRHIPFKNGDVYRSELAERSVEDIYGTQLFETTKFLAIPDTAGVTLIAKVTEKPSNFIRGGAAFDLDYGSRAFLDLGDDNILGTGQEMYLSTRIGEKKRAVSFNFQTDRIFKSLFTYTFVLDYMEFKRNHYIDHKYIGYFKQFSKGGEISLGRQFPRLGGISLVASLREFDWDQYNKTRRQKFSRLGLGIKSIVDTRDALSFPERGRYHFLNLEFASDIRNEKTAYTKFYMMLEAYYPISKRLNFHPGVAVGASSDFMPYFDEFSLGGLHNFLGLHEDELLGDKILSGFLGARYRIINRLYLMGNYNIGNIWNQLERVRLSTLRYGAGLGLGIKTPVGPVEGWYGFGTDGLDAFYLKIGFDW